MQSARKKETAHAELYLVYTILLQVSKKLTVWKEMGQLSQYND